MQNKKAKASSAEMLTRFLKSHHFQWWGEPAQATTYCIGKLDVHATVAAIIDRAIEEVVEESDTAYSYKTPAYKSEHQWPK